MELPYPIDLKLTTRFSTALTLEIASRGIGTEHSLESGYEEASSTSGARLIARKDGVFDVGGGDDAGGTKKLGVDMARPDCNIIDVYATTIPHETRVSSEAKKQRRFDSKRIDEEVIVFLRAIRL